MATEVEFAGVKFRGGKIFAIQRYTRRTICGVWILQRLSKYESEDWKLYSPLISKQLEVTQTKLDEALDYSKDIKNGLRDDIVRVEKILDQVEDEVNEMETKVREMIDIADQRYENKRDQLLTEYEQKADSLRTSTDLKLKELETRLNKRLQRALDNPLAQ